MFTSLSFGACDNIVVSVRAAVAQNNLAKAEQEIATCRNSGLTRDAAPGIIEAISWVARGALKQNQLDQAGRLADEAYRLSTAELRHRGLDDEPQLPNALGAAIEVKAQVLNQRGAKAEALDYLRTQVTQWHATSIRTRIQKNLNLLSLEGKPAPPLEIQHWLGRAPRPLSALHGHPVLLFFWAHWCGDCKIEAASLARLMPVYGPRGLVLIAPTQRYGYTALKEQVSPEEEVRYIDEIRRRSYARLGDVPTPVSEENFRRYGASTTPTLVLIDRNGIVRMFHPGRMEDTELSAQVKKLFPAAPGLHGNHGK